MSNLARDLYLSGLVCGLAAVVPFGCSAEGSQLPGPTGMAAAGGSDAGTATGTGAGTATGTGAGPSTGTGAGPAVVATGSDVLPAELEELVK